MGSGLIQKILIWAIPVLTAIIFHEVAHGWVASKFGDKTALMMGRLTLNPLKHIDPVGTILVPGLLLLASTTLGGGFIFGWAKPVPVNPRNMKHPRRDMAIVAAAGPFSNVIMAVCWAGIAKLAMMMHADMGNEINIMFYMGQAGVFINLMLAILNIIPIPPLDGGRVVSNLLPPRQAYYYDKIEPFGFIIIIALLITGILGFVLGRLVFACAFALMGLFGIM